MKQAPVLPSRAWSIRPFKRSAILAITTSKHYGIVTHEPLTPEDSFGHSLGFDTADRVFLRQRLLRRRDDRGGNLRLGGNNGEGKRFGSSGHRFGRRGFRLHRRVGYRDSAFRRDRLGCQSDVWATEELRRTC